MTAAAGYRNSTRQAEVVFVQLTALSNADASTIDAEHTILYACNRKVVLAKLSELAASGDDRMNRLEQHYQKLLFATGGSCGPSG